MAAEGSSTMKYWSDACLQLNPADPQTGSLGGGCQQEVLLLTKLQRMLSDYTGCTRLFHL